VTDGSAGISPSWSSRMLEGCAVGASDEKGTWCLDWRCDVSDTSRNV
jgi:hypothetical protein